MGFLRRNRARGTEITAVGHGESGREYVLVQDDQLAGRIEDWLPRIKHYFEQSPDHERSMLYPFFFPHIEIQPEPGPVSDYAAHVGHMATRAASSKRRRWRASRASRDTSSTS